LRYSRGQGGIASTATRVTPGAISRISSSHFPLMPYSIEVKPVALPPGCARLSTKPAPTGSGVSVNTIGTVRVACSVGTVVGSRKICPATSGLGQKSGPCRHLGEVALSPKPPERPDARCVASGAGPASLASGGGTREPQEPAMRKIFGVVVFATALIGSASVASAQSSRDLTEPTGTE